MPCSASEFPHSPRGARASAPSALVTPPSRSTADFRPTWISQPHSAPANSVTEGSRKPVEVVPLASIYRTPLPRGFLRVDAKYLIQLKPDAARSFFLLYVGI